MTEAKKPGRPKKEEQKQETAITELQEQIDNLRNCIVRISHQVGTDSILRQFNIEKYNPSKADMGKYKG